MELLLLLPCSVVVLSLAISAAQLASSLLVSSNSWVEGGGGVAAPMLPLLPMVVSSPPPSPVWTGSVGGRDSTSMLPSEITAKDRKNEETTKNLRHLIFYFLIDLFGEQECPNQFFAYHMSAILCFCLDLNLLSL
jgi:hypothetical protein